jgi:hypothetical protein
VAKVPRDELLRDGYVILRGVIPRARLGRLRRSFEVLVGRQKALWAQARGASDPPGGLWELSPQPRLFFHALVDKSTADTVELCLGDATLGQSRALMNAPRAAPILMTLMCSPTRDHGPAHWHRDIHPFDQAPLAGLQADTLHNGPGYLQWNLPLYDDDVLWVVPGSHRRASTEEENRLLAENPRRPLPGAIPAELRAGDAAVYTNTILHWGSNYSSKLRRTVHLGYRSFGSALYPYVPHFYWDLGFTQHLPAPLRLAFRRFARWHAAERKTIEAAFRALLLRRRPSFLRALKTLHPSPSDRLVCAILLGKLAHKVELLHRASVRTLAPAMRAAAIKEHPTSLYLYEDMAGRFSPREAQTLSRRFAWLDERLKTKTETYLPAYQSGPTRYSFYDMPARLDVADFVASWA